MRRLWKRLYGAVTHAPYWEGVSTGIALGELFERDRIAQVIRDEFVDLPAYTYTVTKPEELGEYLAQKILMTGEKHD